MKKRLLSTLLVLVMLLGLLPAGVLTASADEGDETFDLLGGDVTLTYSVVTEIDKTCATIKKCEINNGATGIDLVIPTQVGNLPTGATITAIKNDAFIECTGLASITIPESVTDIGSEAFRDCTNLETITILPSDTYKTKKEVEDAISYAEEKGLTAKIGATAFLRCRALKTINIPARVVEIGQNAFRGCTGLTSIWIWNPETKLGQYQSTTTDYDIFGGGEDKATGEGKKFVMYCQKGSTGETYQKEGHERWIWFSDIFGRALSFTMVYPEPNDYKNDNETIGTWPQVYWIEVDGEPGVTFQWSYTDEEGNKQELTPQHLGKDDFDFAETDPHWIEGANYNLDYTVEFTLNPAVANWYRLPEGPVYAKDSSNPPTVTYDRQADDTGSLTFSYDKATGQYDDQYTDRTIIVLEAKDEAALAGTVMGKVVDSEEEQPLSAATISLVATDDTVLATVNAEPDREDGTFTARADISGAAMTGASGKEFKVAVSAEGYKDAEIYYDYDEDTQSNVPFSMNLGRVPYERYLQISLKPEDSYGLSVVAGANEDGSGTYKVTITAEKNGLAEEAVDGVVYYRLFADLAAATGLPEKGDEFDKEGWEAYAEEDLAALDPETDGNYVYAVYVVEGIVMIGNGTELVESGVVDPGPEKATLTLRATGDACGSATIDKVTVNVGETDKADVTVGDVTLNIEMAEGHENCAVEVKLGDQTIQAKDGAYTLPVTKSDDVTVTFTHAGSVVEPETVTYTVTYNLDGGAYSGGDLAPETFANRPAGAAVTLTLEGYTPGGGILTKAGKVFTGWDITPAGVADDKEEDAGGVTRYVLRVPAGYNSDTNITLTATWADAITYTVKYVLGEGGKYNGEESIADEVFANQILGEATTLWLAGIAPDGELTNDDSTLVSKGWLVTPSGLYIDKPEQEGEEEVSCYVINIPANTYDEDTTITLTAQWEAASHEQAHEHDWGDTPVKSEPATCTDNGYAEYECSICGETKTETEFAKGHTAGDWVITKKPTCTATGVRIKTCTACGKTVASETIPAPEGGHDYREESRDTKATGTACGEITVLHLVCAKCGDAYDKTLEGTNHKGVKAYGSVAPTCFKDGLTGGSYCTVCGEVIEPRTVVPAGHEKVTTATPADCTTPAYTITSCKVCKTVLEKKETGVALGHDFDVDGTPDGKGAIIHACSRCDAQWAETRIVLDNVAEDDNITVTSGGGSGITVTLDEAVVDGLKEKLGGSADRSVTFVIETIDTETQLDKAYGGDSGLKGAVRDYAAKKDAKVVHITLEDKDGKPLLPDTNSGVGNITVKVPYTKRYDASGEITVYYVDAKGNFQKYDDGTYEDGFVTFTTKHFSTFVVNEVCSHKNVPYETVYAATADSPGLKQGVCSDCFEVLAAEIPQLAPGTDTTPTSITLNQTKLSLAVGETATLKATVEPVDAEVTWESDNAAVATVTAAGRVAAISKGTATITATAGDITASCAVTVTDGSGDGGKDPGSGNPPAPGGGNGSSGGSGGSTNVSSPSTDAGSGSTTVDVTTASTTTGATAKAAVSAANMDKAVASAVAEAAKQGTAPVVRVKVTTSDKADGLNVTLPVSSLRTLAETADSSLVIDSGVAGMALDHAALNALAGQAAGSTVVLEITPVAASSLSAAQRQAVGTAPVMDLSLVSGGVAIHEYNSGRITVTLPYALAEGRSAGDVVVYRLEDDGSLTPCETGYSDGKVTFTTTHLSKYVIGAGEMAGQVRKIAFTDVAETAYYYDAVVWGVENGITLGVTDTAFGPEQACTRAQIVSFLWRRAGSPKMSGTNPFTDVAETDYYYDAVLWAAENGVTYGTTPTTFSPYQTCTRAQAVSFLYRCKSSPAVSGGNSFTDVSETDYYYDAVRWAAESGVTTGATATTFEPGQDCTRAQIISFMYRDRADG